jgi:UDP-N-acetylglucosamine 1-carboxyvinyltransferase
LGDIIMSRECIKVRGGGQLDGTLRVAGAKNSVLKLMAASLLAPGVNTIGNVPDISDVHIMREVLERLGASATFVDGCLTIDTSSAVGIEAPYDLVTKMRASIAVLGPLVARFGEARVAMPGGCQLGARKLDYHILGLEALGVQFDVQHGVIHATAPKAGLRGADIKLEFASVGATENLMMAATRAKGVTRIDNAAREPEIVDLANYLNCLGARVSGQGTPVIEIDGVGADSVDFQAAKGYLTVGDRIEAGTFLAAAALAGGSVTVTGVNPEHLSVPLMKLRAFGAFVDASSMEDAVTVSRDNAKPLSPVDIQTLPYPGFPTDLQPQFMVLDSIAAGRSAITENIFESRFIFADELNRMGASIVIEGHHAYVEGVPKLSAAPVQAPDLRAGAALVLAGLVADGETMVSEIEHIDRGYAGFVDKLSSLGADVQRQVSPY